MYTIPFQIFVSMISISISAAFFILGLFGLYNNSNSTMAVVGLSIISFYGFMGFICLLLAWINPSSKIFQFFKYSPIPIVLYLLFGSMDSNMVSAKEFALIVCVSLLLILNLRSINYICKRKSRV
jgi:hypothetical protein